MTAHLMSVRSIIDSRGFARELLTQDDNIVYGQPLKQARKIWVFSWQTKKRMSWLAVVDSRSISLCI